MHHSLIMKREPAETTRSAPDVDDRSTSIRNADMVDTRLTDATQIRPGSRSLGAVSAEGPFLF